MITSEETIRLAASIAYEINNPLCGISNDLHLMRQTNLDSSQLESLKAMIRNVDRINSIIRGFLDFAHEKQKEKYSFDLNNLLRTTLRMIDKNQEAWNMKIDVRYDSEPLPILGTPGRLEQVFRNLVANARDAMEGRGRLDITSFRNGQRVMVTFADTGCGMTEEVISHIFDPFYTTKEAGKGAGLGLSISYEIIQEHKGQIEVESELGKGTSLTLSLPLSGSK